MKLNKLLLGLFATALLAFTGCSSEEPAPDPGDDNVAEATKCNGTVSVRILGQDRAASELNPSIDRLTATRCDLEDDTYTLVSYHGRNKEQIGMVQVINRNTNTVVSELYFEDARVNYCAFYNKQGKQVAYVGVDKSDKKQNICGIVAVPMKNGKFDLGDGVMQAALTPYYVDGVSVNCIKFIEQASGNYINSAMIVASGGNNALGADRKAGFTKFKINIANPAVLERTDNNKLDTNFRGYWISNNIETEGGVALPVAYTYRTVEGGNLVFKLAVIMSNKVADFFNPAKPFGTPDAEVEVMRRNGTVDADAEDFGRFSVSMFLLKQGRFIVVSTGSKVLDESEGEGGGVRVYRFDHNNGNPELSLVDVWNKACYNTSNKNTVLSEPYIYAASGANGVFKCKLDYYEPGKKADGTPIRCVQLVPVEKRVTTVLTESNTLASTNYVQCNLNMDKVHVAGGFEGYFTLSLEDSQFVPADPRKDLVKH